MDGDPSLLRRAVAVAVVAVVLLAVIVGAGRERRRAMARRGAFRDFRPGMPLADVAESLRQRGIAFTVDSGDDGLVIAGIGRTSTAGGAQSTEQQIEFDAHGRLRAFRTQSVLRGR